MKLDPSKDKCLTVLTDGCRFLLSFTELYQNSCTINKTSSLYVSQYVKMLTKQGEKEWLYNLCIKQIIEIQL
jgi:hypothetical protein